MSMKLSATSRRSNGLMGPAGPARGGVHAAILAELQRHCERPPPAAPLVDLETFTIFIVLFCERDESVTPVRSGERAAGRTTAPPDRGTALDFPDGWLEDAVFLEWFMCIPEYDALGDHPVRKKRNQGIGIIDAKSAVDWDCQDQCCGVGLNGTCA